MWGPPACLPRTTWRCTQWCECPRGDGCVEEGVCVCVGVELSVWMCVGHHCHTTMCHWLHTQANLVCVCHPRRMPVGWVSSGILGGTNLGVGPYDPGPGTAWWCLLT